MTKIKILNDRIIFDGHAETKQECETITLMCDNLAKSEDFKVIKYESGYAEFEKVGETENLMFPPAQGNLTINFDSNITQVVVVASQGTVTCSTSGSSYDNSTYKFDYTPNPTFTVTLNSGYIIDTVTVEDNGAGGSVTKTSDNTFTGSGICAGGDCAITITSKQGGASKQTIDISTLSGWEALASGDHSITVKTKASGYLDSAASNAVTVSKASNGYQLVVTESGYGGSAAIKYKDGTSANVRAGTYQNVVSIQDVYYQVNDFREYTLTDASGKTHSIPYTLTSNSTIDIYSWPCLVEGTQITLANGTAKAIEDITYDDELLVWNFYEGKFDSAKPAWIKVEEVAPRYNLVKFSNGSEVGFVGPGGNIGYHRIFNKEAGAFTHTGVADTPNGTTTFAQDETFPTVVSQEVVEKEVKFYNVITDKHYNIFANGILTSCRLSNLYKIEDMKYVGERLIADEEIKAYFDKIESKRK